MKMIELLGMLRAMKIKHGDCPIVLGVEVDGQMQIGHIEMVGSVTNEYDEIAVCLATKPLETVEVPELTVLTKADEKEMRCDAEQPHANGEMLTDI